MSLEMDEESDEELESVAGLLGGGGGDTVSPAGSGPQAAPPSGADELRAQRFVVLRDLWASAQ